MSVIIKYDVPAKELLLAIQRVYEKNPKVFKKVSCNDEAFLDLHGRSFSCKFKMFLLTLSVMNFVVIEQVGSTSTLRIVCGINNGNGISSGFEMESINQYCEYLTQELIESKLLPPMQE